LTTIRKYAYAECMLKDMNNRQKVFAGLFLKIAVLSIAKAHRDANNSVSLHISLNLQLSQKYN